MSNSIIDVPLILTSCSGRDRQSVLVKLREKLKDTGTIIMNPWCRQVMIT